MQEPAASLSQSKKMHAGEKAAAAAEVGDDGILQQIDEGEAAEIELA